MTLECIRPFGHSVPGDTVEVPDGATYDAMYFKPAGGSPAPAAPPPEPPHDEEEGE